MDEPEILLTNDDGIDATGLRVLYDALSAVGTVTTVAPADDQSAVGRSVSRSVDVRDHEMGHVVDGTPSDCVIAGLTSLVPDADLVVAGCNRGANVGAAVLGRSGTVSAAVEAAFFDVPAMAVSLYVPVEEYASPEDLKVPPERYGHARRASRYLADRAFGAGVFEEADYLNVNAPVDDGAPAPMAITRPSGVYRMDSERDGGHIELQDNIWEMMASGVIPDSEGTDRRAIVEGKVSVSPLTAPHTTKHHERLDELAEAYYETVQ